MKENMARGLAFAADALGEPGALKGFQDRDARRHEAAMEEAKSSAALQREMIRSKLRSAQIEKEMAFKERVHKDKMSLERARLSSHGRSGHGAEGGSGGGAGSGSAPRKLTAAESKMFAGLVTEASELSNLRGQILKTGEALERVKSSGGWASVVPDKMNVKGLGFSLPLGDVLGHSRVQAVMTGDRQEDIATADKRTQDLVMQQGAKMKGQRAARVFDMIQKTKPGRHNPAETNRRIIQDMMDKADEEADGLLVQAQEGLELGAISPRQYEYIVQRLGGRKSPAREDEGMEPLEEEPRHGGSRKASHEDQDDTPLTDAERDDLKRLREELGS